MSEQTCYGCAHWPDFPGHIKCQGCARIYNDHYEDTNQDKIIKLRIVFTQYTNGKQYAISGGYYDTTFICKNYKLQNVHPLDFPITESDEATILQLVIKNPSDNMTLCSSYESLAPHVVSAHIKEHNWSIAYEPSMEYMRHVIQANATGTQKGNDS